MLQRPATTKDTTKLDFSNILIIKKLVMKFVKAERADAEPIKNSGYISELISHGIDAIPAEYANKKMTMTPRAIHFPRNFNQS